LGQKVEVRDYESRGGRGQEKDAGGRMKDECEGFTAEFEAFILHPSSFILYHPRFLFAAKGRNCCDFRRWIRGDVQDGAG
jgi:hypothetical protein